MAYVEIDLSEFGDDEMIMELQDRGFEVLDRKVTRSIDKLYRSWQQDSPDTFEKHLKEFFKEHLDLVSV